MSPYDPQRSRHRPSPADSDEPAPVDALLGPVDDATEGSAEDEPGVETGGVDGSVLGAEPEAAELVEVDAAAVEELAVDAGVVEPSDGEPLPAEATTPASVPDAVGDESASPEIEGGAADADAEVEAAAGEGAAEEQVPAEALAPRVAPGPIGPAQRRPSPVAALALLAAVAVLIWLLRRRRSDD